MYFAFSIFFLMSEEYFTYQSFDTNRELEIYYIVCLRIPSLILITLCLHVSGPRECSKTITLKKVLEPVYELKLF